MDVELGTTEKGQTIVEQSTETSNRKREERKGDFNSIKGFSLFIFNFTPSWFSINMGTGIVGIVLHNCPYQFIGLSIISIIFYILNIILFCFFVVITILRYTMFPSCFKLMLSHPIQSLFIGTIPMGLSTIVNATVLIAVPYFGQWASSLSTILWWIDVILSLSSCIFIPFLMIVHHKHKFEKMLATWLLPIVPAVVCSASGGIVASVQIPSQAIVTLFVSYALWGIGILLSFSVLSLYLNRLFLHQIPSNEFLVSVMLPLGPLGQGSFGLIQLATVGKSVFTDLNLVQLEFSDVIYNGSVLIGFLMWSFGTWWFIIGILSIFSRIKNKIPFNMGWWGLTFPLGVYITSTIIIGNCLQSEFFHILATIYIIFLVSLWAMVTIKTIQATISGKLVSPCVSHLRSNQTS